MAAVAVRLHDETGCLTHLLHHAVVGIGCNDDVSLFEVRKIFLAVADAQVCCNLLTCNSFSLYQNMSGYLYLDEVGRSGYAERYAGSQNNHVALADQTCRLCSVNRIVKQFFRLILLLKKQRCNAPGKSELTVYFLRQARAHGKSRSSHPGCSYSYGP